jgi:UPF0716 protein FxsA
MALLALVLVWALAELFVLVEVARAIGTLNAIVLLLVISVIGAWVVKRQGIGIWRRAQSSLGRGDTPGREVADGFLVLVAGALLFVPGFITDVLGALLLLPPVRALVRRYVMKRWHGRTTIVRATYGGPLGPIVDAQTHEGTIEPHEPRRPPGELGR